MKRDEFFRSAFEGVHDALFARGGIAFSALVDETNVTGAAHGKDGT